MPDNGLWHGPPNPGHDLYTTISAVGSYGYGLIPVRIKLRPGVYGSPSEYDIQNSNVVESWSFGTPEHYDEIIRDIQRSESKKPWIGYWHSYWALSSIPGGPPGDKLFFTLPLDGHDFTEENLKTALLDVIQTILNGDGRIYYAEGTCRNRKREFETRFPTYINPFPEATAVVRSNNGGTPMAAPSGLVDKNIGTKEMAAPAQ